MYCPVRKRGVCPKLRSHWQGQGEILDRVSEVVYRLRMPGARGRVVVLHQDRLSPYRPLAPVVADEGTPRGSPAGSPVPAGSPDGAVGPAAVAPRGAQRPNRQRRAPEHLKDYVSGDGVVGDDRPLRWELCNDLCSQHVFARDFWGACCCCYCCCSGSVASCWRLWMISGVNGLGLFIVVYRCCHRHRE